MKEGIPEEEVVSLAEMVEIIIGEQQSSEASVLGLRVAITNIALRKIRQKTGLTQKQLGKMVGVSSHYIGRFETLRSYPNPELTGKIANVLGRRAQDIFPPYLQEFIRDKNTPSEILLEMPMSEVDRVLIAKAMAREALGEENDPAEEVGKTLLGEQIEVVLELLPYRERRVLNLRYGIGDGKQRTLEEVGREFGVTWERIRQIEAKAIRKLRHPSRAKYLLDYVEKENKDAHEATEAWENGLISAWQTRDIPRALKLLAKLEDRVNQRKNALIDSGYDIKKEIAAEMEEINHWKAKIDQLEELR